MTYDDAVTVTSMVINAFPGEREWTDHQIVLYAKGIERLDAELATKAVFRAQKTMTRRPTVADLIAITRSVSADYPTGPRYDAVPEVTPRRPKKMPPWVKEWVCARFLYARFGRDQDMRRFVEQGDWRDPSEPLMPPGEWVREAAHITDRDAWSAIRL